MKSQQLGCVAAKFTSEAFEKWTLAVTLVDLE